MSVVSLRIGSFVSGEGCRVRGDGGWQGCAGCCGSCGDAVAGQQCFLLGYFLTLVNGLSKTTGPSAGRALRSGWSFRLADADLTVAEEGLVLPSGPIPGGSPLSAVLCGPQGSS